MDKLRMQSADGVQDNIQKIAALFPNCVTETVVGYHDDGSAIIKRKVDFEKLQQELSDAVISGREERYQFTWPDKRKAILAANAPVNATLRPCREESVDFDTTQNLYIEGDNLDVLKCLKETYLHKVKMIYIDPPYNTGNDFVYEDDFRTESLEFRTKSGDYDEDGNLIVNRMLLNTESNGRFHTDWLNMIYPRLKVARDLLSDDGVIFISIDDNEVENLKKVCDEIFGELNFVATFPWRKRTAKSDVPFGISQDYEWIVVYAKSSNFIASVEGKEREYYTTKDFPNRPWRVHDMSTQRTALERPNSNFTIINPKNGAEYPVNPQRIWAITEEGFPQYLKENRIVFPGDYDFLNISRPVLRYWKDEDMKKAGDSFGRIAVTTKLDEKIGMSQDGTKEITSLFDGKVFSYPKPVNIIKFFANILNEKDSLILDFFSGSATTAHAVMQLNAEDGGNRKFIMVQLPELTDEKSEAYKAGYKNICEIGKERIRRAGDRILELSLENLEKEGVIKKYARELSEVRSLEEIYGRSVISLLTGQESAQGGDIRPVGPDAEGGRVDTVEHSGGAVEGRQRVCAVSENSEGFAGRTGDATIDMRTLELLNRRGYKIVLDSIGGNQQNDLFSDQASTNQNLELSFQNLELSSQLSELSSKLSVLSSKLSVLTLDTGFRVLKLDSTNMEDIYYSPKDTEQRNLFNMVDNVKPDRTSEDLLFQVMLELGATLDSKIEVIRNEELGMRNDGKGYTIYNVADGYLVACFDQDVTDDVVTAIAKMQPMYAVLRDTSMATDSTATNFEQIFKTYAPNTVTKIL